jgi:hypothetical protein
MQLAEIELSNAYSVCLLRFYICGNKYDFKQRVSGQAETQVSIKKNSDKYF